MLAIVSRLTLCDIQVRAALQSFNTACFRERCANISKPSNKSRHLFEGFSGQGHARNCQEVAVSAAGLSRLIGAGESDSIHAFKSRSFQDGRTSIHRCAGGDHIVNQQNGVICCEKTRVYRKSA